MFPPVLFFSVLCLRPLPNWILAFLPYLSFPTLSKFYLSKYNYLKMLSGLQLITIIGVTDSHLTWSSSYLNLALFPFSF